MSGMTLSEEDIDEVPIDAGAVAGAATGSAGIDGPGSGIARIIGSAAVSYERLPMLEIVFDRVVRLLSTTLRNFTSDNVEVSIEGISSLRFGDYLNGVPQPAMLAVFVAPEWDNNGLVVVDGPLIYSIVDVLLGGRRGTAAIHIESRAFTTIERTLVERLVQVVLNDLSGAFQPICPVHFAFERLEVNPRFTVISRSSNACILVKLRVEMEDRGGTLDILLPYATLEPVRELLLQQVMGEKFGHDRIWESHFAEMLRDTEVTLDVILAEQVLPLAELLALKVGDQINLGVSAGAPVQLRCGDISLFEAQLGRREERLAIRIERELRESMTEAP